MIPLRVVLRTAPRLFGNLPLVAVSVVAALLSGCVPNTPRLMNTLPPSSPLLSAMGLPEFETADKWSFTQAVFRYFAHTDQYHMIPVGDYLLSRLLEPAKANQVSGLRLVEFSNTGKMGFGLAGRHIVSFRCAISYRRSGAIQTATFAVTDKDIGAVYVGDFSVIPFTSGGQTNDGIFHAQIKPLLDEAIAAFTAHMEKST